MTPWVLRMALRDLRRARVRLLLFVFVLSVGVAAIVAIRSFRTSLDRAIDSESRQLLGADMVITTRVTPDAEVTAFLNAVPGEKLRAVHLTTMASLGDTLRLVQLRAIDPGFPFFGTFETEPPDAMQQVFAGEGALVDETLLEQSGVSIGGEIRIGKGAFRVVGKLVRVPGEIVGYSLVAPRVYISRSQIEGLSLLGQGSQARYKWFYRSTPMTAVFVAANGVLFKKFRLDRELASERREGVGRTIERVSMFLNIAGAAALLLGGIGIASGTAVYLRGKRESARVLLLLGARKRLITAIYLVQILLLSLGGCTAGALLGFLVQLALPGVLRTFLPIEVPFSLSLWSVVEGLLAGMIVAALSALTPLLRLWTSRRSRRRLLLPRGLVSRLPFAPAQGIRSLSRPGNQTAAVITVLGAGLGVIIGIVLSDGALTREFALTSGEHQPNMILFDIQRDQLPSVREAVQREGHTVWDEANIVPMKLTTINGRPVSAVMRERDVPSWVFRREYRSTYRERLTETERIVQGEFPGAKRGDAVPVSIEEGIAKDMGVKVGDVLEFDVQGLQVPAWVASLREVNWKRVRPNFFIVFPPGVLEEAPQFFALTTRVPSSAESARFQKALSAKFPNIAAIDLRTAIESVEGVLAKIRQASHFMGLFTVVVGMIVLLSAIAASAYERVQEVAVLKVLGATKRMVRLVTFSEFAALGCGAAVVALLVGYGAAWGVTVYLLKVPFAGGLRELTVLFVVPIGVATVGMLTTMGSYRLSPLEVLREE